MKTIPVTLKMFATGNEERCPVMLFKRTIPVSGKATERNEEKRSALLPCHRQADFKRLVQENPNEKKTP